MAILRKLLASSMPWGLANALEADIGNALVATGSSQSDALPIAYGVSRFTTVDASTGAILPANSVGDSVLVINAGANALSVYPPSGHSINSLAANAAYSIPVNGIATFKRVTNTLWFSANGTQNFVSVTDFGAVLNGSTDDATAVQNAINSLTNGGIVFFPPGVCKVASKITIPDNIPIILRGSGIPDQSASAATGTELRSTLRDGTSAAIDAESAADDFAFFGMEDLYLSGGTYAEVIGGPGQGGAALGNYAGLLIRKRHRWQLRNCRIAGFDTNGFRYQGSFYGAAYSCAFMWNGVGVNNVDGSATDGFYNCHFQYNSTGTQNVLETYGCAWEGQWNSAAKYDILNVRATHYSPYFEANNASSTANQADIFADTTNYPYSISLYSPRFISGSAYSAKAAATHNFNGRCTQLYIYGNMMVSSASPQNYALFKLVSATTMYDNSGTTKNFANYVTFTTGSGEYKDLADGYLDVTLSTATLTHFNYRTIRLTAGGAINMDNIDPGYFGGVLKLLFGDANITVRHNGGGTGNIRLTGGTNFTGSARDTMLFMYEPNGDIWVEISRAAVS